MTREEMEKKAARVIAENLGIGFSALEDHKGRFVDDFGPTPWTWWSA